MCTVISKDQEKGIQIIYQHKATKLFV